MESDGGVGLIVVEQTFVLTGEVMVKITHQYLSELTAVIYWSVQKAVGKVCVNLIFYKPTTHREWPDRARAIE